MFDWFRERREKNNIKTKFLKEHDLPKYSPESGIPLRWNIEVIQNGPYDTKTGEPLGDFEVIVNQVSPRFSEIIIDRRVYVYNIKSKKLEVDDSYIWTV